MGKGKIFISQESSEDQAEDHQKKVEEQNENLALDKKIHKQKKKLKKKKKKVKQANNPRREMAAIQMLDQLNEKYRKIQQEQQQVQYDNKGSGMLNKKTIFKQKKCDIKHVAICFPDSILEIPQTSALRAYFISEVARVSSIFKVDEIIILKDYGYTAKSQNFHPAEYIARNLQYLQTPQYLRKHLFKMHPDLKNAGLMNPIQCHHHLKTSDICQFREGVALDRPTKKNCGSWVDIGLKQQAQMNVLVPAGTRVTLRLQDYQNPDAQFYNAQAVSSKTPRQQKDLYWGYSVRIANSIKQMLDPKIQQQYPYTTKILCNANKPLQSLPILSPSDQNFREMLMSNMEEENESIIIFFSGTDDLKTLIEKDIKNKMCMQEVEKMFDYSLQFNGYGVQKLRVQEQMWMGIGPLVSLRE